MPNPRNSHKRDHGPLFQGQRSARPRDSAATSSGWVKSRIALVRTGMSKIPRNYRWKCTFSSVIAKMWFSRQECLKVVFFEGCLAESSFKFVPRAKNDFAFDDVFHERPNRRFSPLSFWVWNIDFPHIDLIMNLTKLPSRFVAEKGRRSHSTLGHLISGFLVQVIVTLKKQTLANSVRFKTRRRNFVNSTRFS